jgi:hypothetical protein
MHAWSLGEAAVTPNPVGQVALHTVALKALTSPGPQGVQNDDAPLWAEPGEQA